MKTNIFLLSAGLVATFFFTQMKVHHVAGSKTVQVEQVNTTELGKLNNLIMAERKHASEPRTKNTINVVGAHELATKVEELFNHLKTNQVLFRYDFHNAMKPFLERAKTLDAGQVVAFNSDLTQTIERKQKDVETLKFDSSVKADIVERMEKIKNTVHLSESVVTVHARKPSNEKLLNDISESLKSLKTSQPVTVEAEGYDQQPNPAYLAGIWAMLLLASIALSAKPNETKSDVSANSSEEDDKVNPTLKRILLDIDYPLFMVDPSLEIVWKNKKTDELNLNTKMVQEIFSNRDNNEATFKMNGRDYKLNFSDLAFKSGKVNHLVQCRPEVVSARHLDHLMDSSEVTAMLEGFSQNGEVTFGDVNQTTAQLAVKLGYLFKVSGKYLDIDFKKDMSDCFIEKDRLEKIIKEFMMSCHHMIKDQSEAEGIYLRTDEAGNKFSVSCFLANYKVDSLNTHPMARDFLKRFSILEARYASCNPSIDFRIVENGDVKGLDISISFENQSELESIMSNVSASA